MSGFTPLFTYKVLKLLCISIACGSCFTPLFTYKVLKLCGYVADGGEGFTPLFTYKVLKQSYFEDFTLLVSHLYLLTRFSNEMNLNIKGYHVSHLYLLTRFSNHESQRYIMTIVSHLYLLTRFSNLKSFFQGHHRTHNILAYVQAFS